MATYSLPDVSGTTLVLFDPSTDVLAIPHGNMNQLMLVADGADTMVMYGSWSVRLQGIPASLLTGEEFEFADGSTFRQGTAASDALTGTDARDQLVIDAGGDDTISAGAGDDHIRAGSSLTAADSIDGGTGSDTLYLAGGGESTVVFGAGTVTGVESFVIGAGGTVRLQLHDAVFSGSSPGFDFLVVDARQQQQADALFLDASAILAGHRTYAIGGRGADTLIGGAGPDSLLGGDGNDSLDGGSGNDYLSADAGHDTLDGGEGADTMDGGDGADTYVVRDAGDSTVELAPGSSDRVLSYLADHVLDDAIEDGWIMLATGARLSGNDANNNLFGGEGADHLYGGWGTDSLVGGGGADWLEGGAGDDIYRVQDAGDVVVETNGSGRDWVLSELQSYTLPDSVEIGWVWTAAAAQLHGNASDNSLLGGSGDDTLTGGAGADTLNGSTGDDRLEGGSGADSYFVDQAGDILVEVADGGFDTVMSTISLILGDHLERLVLGGLAVEGIGNALNNEISGNHLANLIDGGDGADAMSGGGGDDTYFVDDSGDSIYERGAEGTDQVFSSAASFSMVSSIEHGTILRASGAALQGNGEANRLTGGEGADTLRGGYGDDTLFGGAGADSLDGGHGDDSYDVDQADDIAGEADGSGSDTVYAAIGWTLGRGLENLVLSGASSVAGTGNDLANRIAGNAGANLLSGGAGNDTLSGGDGDDTLLGGTGADHLEGGAGNDGYHVDHSGDVVADDVSGEDTVTAAVDFQLAGGIEHLVLTGSLARVGTGNGLANTIVGNAVDNVLDGAAGADTLRGGRGDDVYHLDDAADRVEEAEGEGIDTIVTSVSHDLGVHEEHLTLVGNAALTGVGNSGSNVLRGNAGASTLSGGDGDDTYHVDADDTVLESADGGTDTVISSGSRALGAHQEHLTLSGAADLVADGNEMANILRANAGASTLRGGDGDDVYHVDADDEIVEFDHGGVDTIFSDGHRVLGVHQENLILTGASALAGRGNALANLLRGNAGDNVIDGAGGADTMEGGAGSDTYHVDDAGDLLLGETGTTGSSDKVIASIGWTLGEHFEQLELDGAGSVHATGNTLDNLIAGNSGANAIDGGLGADTMAGGDGNDTYRVDDRFDVVVESGSGAGGVDTIVSSVAYTLGAFQENLRLTGDVWISGDGNSLDNVITGNASNNTLDGAEGADTLSGGGGHDEYHVDDVGDVVIEVSGDGGWDTVVASVNFALGAHLERLSMAVGALRGTGNAQANFIDGNHAGNVIDGGAGADELRGGDGDDTYHVDDAGDIVYEDVGRGTDTVISSVTRTLGSDQEHLTLTGTAALDGTGNGLVNVLRGNDGANVLNGAAGADTLAGGKGNDTYYLDDSGDDIYGESSSSSGGIDTVITSVDYAATKDYVENLTAASGTASIDLTGNQLANVLAGNDGRNILNGAAGADVMRGGKGNDTYYLDDSKDDIYGESSSGSGGIDTVITSVDYAATKDYVENLTAASGTASIDLTGNQLANVLTGNDGRNILNGAAGADVLRGGKGNDTYYIDNTKDNIDGESSAGSGGIDKVVSSVSFSIASDYVEQLFLSGSLGISATGNKLANLITGNSGKNTLDGGSGNDTLQGGGGADKLVGGSGSDFFVFAAASDSTSKALDLIADFTRGSDRIDLSHLDGNAGKSGHQDFSFIGSKAFGSNASGQLRLAVESGKVMLYGSTDADATAEFALQVQGTTSLSAGDLAF